MDPNTLFIVPEAFGGKSLGQLGRSGYNLGRSDVLAGYFGLGENSPLTAGQALKLAPGRYAPDFGGSEFDAIRRYFTTQTPEQYQSSEAQKAIAPAVSTLQAGMDPLKQRYADLIASIKGKGTEAERQAGIGAAQEFGKRGIPLSSGAYDQFLQSRTLPVTTQFSGLEAETGLGAENAVNAIRSAIASLQGQAGMKGFDAATSTANALRALQEEQRQFDITAELRKQELAKTEQPDQYKVLGEGSTLFDLLSGRSVFTAPKTYKPGGGSDSDPLGLGF